MIEVRIPRPEELDEMLAVMCEAFHLPFGPASDVFYKDPYFDVRRKRVLVTENGIASCLTVVDAPLWIGDAVVPVAGVAGVATRQAERNQGHATRLLQDAMPALRELGYGIAALFAVSAAFYRRLEWEPVASQVQITLPRAALTTTREARYVRAALPSDLPDLIRLYDDWSRRRTGCRIRDEKRWRYLFEHVKHRVVYKRRDTEGYALYDVRDAEGGRPVLRLLELVATTDTAQRGIHAHLAQRPDCEKIEFTAGWREIGESGLIRPAGAARNDFASAGTLTMAPGPLVRIIDFERCMTDLAPNWRLFEGPVTLCLRERPADRNAAAAVTIESGQVRRAKDGENPRARVDGDSRTWAAVAFGHLSLSDAVAVGRLRATTDAVAERVAPLFPRREFTLPAADHF